MLAAVGRNEAPVIVADVTAPVFCVQGLYSNGRGQPQLVEWMAITEAVRPDGDRRPVRGAGQGRGAARTMPNPGRPIDWRPCEAELPAVVAAAQAELERRRAAHDAELDAILAEPTERLARWVQKSTPAGVQLDERRRRDRENADPDVRQGHRGADRVDAHRRPTPGSGGRGAGPEEAAVIFESITNRGEFFSNHYLDAVIGGDLNGLRQRGRSVEDRGEATARSRPSWACRRPSSPPGPRRPRRRRPTGPPPSAT